MFNPLSLYLTFKGLKQENIDCKFLDYTCLYLTFKGLKPQFVFRVINGQRSLYLTFKGLKHIDFF